MPSTSTTKPTETKSEAHYEPVGMPQSHCGICQHFVKPNACEIVKGRVTAKGWCRYFDRKE